MAPTLSYLEFHAVFTVPVLLGLWYLAPRYDSPRRRRAAAGLAILVAIAYAYTTPWGSYMIRNEVWWYGDGAVAARYLDIPVGEYMFFALQTLIAGLYLHVRGFDATFRNGDLDWLPRMAGTLVGLGMFAGGLFLVAFDDSYLYLGGLVAWVGPVIALQWAVGGGYLVREARPWVEAALVPSIYLWVIDRLAIGMGAWTISDAHTVGVAVLGLPIEEIFFFVSASLMTVIGLVLFEWVLDWNDQTRKLDRYVPMPLLRVVRTDDGAST